MLNFLRLRKLRAVLAGTPEEQPVERISFFIDCFTAGFARGVSDARHGLQSSAWIAQVSETSMRLASEHSPEDAGCWLAGVINGRISALEDEQLLSSRPAFDELARECFYKALQSGHILECAEHTISSDAGPASMLFELDDAVLPG